MNSIFSLVSILVVVGAAIWWFGFSSRPVNDSGKQISEVNIPDNMVDLINNPIEAAKEAKDNIEIKTGAVLDYSNKSLTKVPESIFSQTEARQLNLSENNLTGALPGEIRFLSNLTVLDLSDNNFTGVPAEVGQLSQLEELDLSNNSLTGLPQELGNLKKLKVLNLSGNTYSASDLSIIKEKLPASVTIITK